MSNKSMIETAYDVFVKQGNSPKSLSFKELCQAVRDELGITDDEEFISKVGAFYTSLALDGRLVLLSDNTWDLRSRHTYDEIKKNTLEYYDTETADKDENDEDCDVEIKCPYCNETFTAQMNDLTAAEIVCPECNNTIELDWGEDEDGCGEGGCDCCSHGCHHDEDEDDDM